MEKLIEIDELSKMLPDKPSKSTIYMWACYKKIPYKKFGRKLFFNKQEIEEWNNNGRPLTIKNK